MRLLFNFSGITAIIILLTKKEKAGFTAFSGETDEFRTLSWNFPAHRFTDISHLFPGVFAEFTRRRSGHFAEKADEILGIRITEFCRDAGDGITCVQESVFRQSKTVRVCVLRERHVLFLLQNSDYFLILLVRMCNALPDDQHMFDFRYHDVYDPTCLTTFLDHKFQQQCM